MNTDNYIFSKQIYKSINKDGSVRQLVSIDIRIKDVGISIPTPFTAFLLEYQSRKASTVSIVASLIVRFLNYLFFEMVSPITTIADLTFQNGIDFLSALPCQKGVKTQYAEYLTKFYYFCMDHKMAEIKDLKEHSRSQYKTYTENIFKGRYKAESKQKVDRSEEHTSELQSPA